MDRNSDTTTLSPMPFSPFSPAHSTHSFASGSDAGTSDEPADLGEFTSVFRALNELHLNTAPTAASRIAASRTDSQNQALGTPSSSLLVSPSDDEERDLIDFNDYVDEGDSVWNNNEVSEYLGFGDALEEFSRAGPSSFPQRRRSHSLSAHRELYPTHSEDLLASDSEDVEVNISISPTRSYSQSQSPLGYPVIPTRLSVTSNLDSINQPSLGLLDEALGFLQAEREKFAAQREAGIRIPASAISASNSNFSLGLSSSLPLSRSLSQKDVDSTFQSQASTSESRSSAWRHVIEPRRKRRRKRGGKNGGASANGNGTGVNSVVMSASGSGQEVDGEMEANGFLVPTGDTLDAGSSSGPEAELAYGRGGKSMPATPPRASRRAGRGSKGKQPALAVSIPNTAQGTQGHKLSHSRSTPSLRPGPVSFMSTPAVQATTGAAIVAGTDPRVLRLRALATKLRMFFTDDAEALSAVLKGPGLSQARKVNAGAEDDGELLFDPRGRPPEEDDPIVHVFIDHSNILIGFLNYIRRLPSRRHLVAASPGGSQSRAHGSWHMSHAALSLILERGRPVSRRVLVTSSPLYQPMESAERLGYEVRVYARVPDTGDGADRLAKAERLGGGRFGRGMMGDSGAEARRTKRRAQAPTMSHARKISTGESADSDPGSNNIAKEVREKGHSRASSLNAIQAQAGTSAPATSRTNAGTNGAAIGALSSPQRVRYREQGVDELLQLKLLQAVSSLDTPHPPPRSTIVLATGDGNVGQFNEEGFRGCVRTALKRGWRVELYAWENGMSRSWLSEFGSGTSSSPEDTSGPYGDRFRIIGLEKFAQDLLELPS